MESISEDRIHEFVFFCPHHRSMKSVPLDIHESQPLYAIKKWYGRCARCNREFKIGEEDEPNDGIVRLKMQPSIKKTEFNYISEKRKLKRNRIYFSLIVIGYIMSFLAPTFLYPVYAIDILVAMTPSLFWIMVSFILFKDKIIPKKGT